VHRLLGHRDRQDQREQQVGGQQGFHQRQLEVAKRPGRQQLPGHHARDADQPPGLAQQVGQDPQAQETGLGLLPRGVLLEDEADPEQHGGHKRDRIVHIQVHVLCLTRC
jgi:hypothetical protein